ncbi:MAG: hypothetical protein O7D97_07845 [Planctomycetota bacterium]|nr:hypothetical protein [Planctomycetota bacterium]
MLKRRTVLLLIGFPFYVLLLSFLSTLLWVLVMAPMEGWAVWGEGLVDAFPWVDEPNWWVVAILPALLIATTQYLFLAPVFDVRLRVQKGGRPLMRSLIGAAFVGALGMTALLLALTDVVGLLRNNQAREYDNEWSLFAIIFTTLACSWLIWTPLLAIFSRRRPHRTTPGRLVGLLLGGTIAEMVVIIPVDLLVRYRGQCYCATASFHGTWLAVLALLWLTGPGIVLAVTSRRRRAWLAHHCANCGYAKGPSPGPVCPECSYAWVG